MPIPQKNERRGANLSMSSPALIPEVKTKNVMSNLFQLDYIYMEYKYTRTFQFYFKELGKFRAVFIFD